MLDKLALKNLMTPCSEKSIVEQIQPHILCPNECKCSIALGQQGPYGASTPHKKDEVENWMWMSTQPCLDGSNELWTNTKRLTSYLRLEQRWLLKIRPKCINTCINVTLVPTHRRIHAQKIRRASFLMRASWLPRRAKHSWSSAAFTGGYRSRTPNRSSPNPNPKGPKGPGQTQAPPDSTFSGSCCAPLCCYFAPFFHSVTTFLWGKKNR